jgi:hypothetical protein
MPDLDITWVSKCDKQRCIDGLLLVLSWAIERKVKKASKFLIGCWS